MTDRLSLRLLSLVALVFVAGCLPDAAADNGAEGPDVPTVRVERVGESTPLEARRFVGRVEAVSTVDLAFQLAGQIVELQAQEGEVYPAGTPLAALDPADFELALARAEASLELARAEFARARDLTERGAAPEARRDQALADLRLAEVEVETAARNLELTRIVLPFDAQVTRRLADRFAYVAAGDPVARVQDVSELRVRISVPEDLIGFVRRPDGFQAFVRLPAVPGFAAPLALREFVGATDNLTQTYEVSFAIEAPAEGQVLPGMTAGVEIRANGAAGTPTLAVPAAAIDPNGSNGFQVWIFDGESGTVTPRAVTLGLPDGDHVPVLDGLAAGETIVGAGVQHLAPGQRVRALNL